MSIEALGAYLPRHLDLRETVMRLERALITRALDIAHGVQAEAARHLGLSRSDLSYKVGKYGLNEPSAQADSRDPVPRFPVDSR